MEPVNRHQCPLEPVSTCQLTPEPVNRRRYPPEPVSRCQVIMEPVNRHRYLLEPASKCQLTLEAFGRCQRMLEPVNQHSQCQLVSILQRVQQPVIRCWLTLDLVTKHQPTPAQVNQFQRTPETINKFTLLCNLLCQPRHLQLVFPTRLQPTSTARFPNRGYTRQRPPLLMSPPLPTQPRATGTLQTPSRAPPRKYDLPYQVPSNRSSRYAPNHRQNSHHPAAHLLKPHQQAPSMVPQAQTSTRCHSRHNRASSDATPFPRMRLRLLTNCFPPVQRISRCRLGRRMSSSQRSSRRRIEGGRRRRRRERT